MNHQDPNLAVVELVAAALGPLRSELVLVGGCSVGLLITDRARPPVRQTVDVDLVAEVTSRLGYYALCEELRQRGFQESAAADHMCRWKRGELLLDVMPSDDAILGHSANRWYPYAVSSANRLLLPSGSAMLVIAPPLFLATKLEAFHDRGQGDYGHHDMEDIINVVDGRPELVEEVDQTSTEVRTFIRNEFDYLLADADFVDGIPRHLRTDAASQGRAATIVERLQRLAGL